MADLLLPERLPDLGPGRPNLAIREQLVAVTAETLFDGIVADAEMAQACISALWLYHDFLDESHRISQTIENSTGSYWHGLMHRREPDFENTKYWFRRVGSHPIFPGLAAVARQCAAEPASAAGLERGQPPRQRTAWLNTVATWAPFAFIDACRDCLDVPGPDRELCRRISLLEWQLLFDFSYRRAKGNGE